MHSSPCAGARASFGRTPTNEDSLKTSQQEVKLGRIGRLAGCDEPVGAVPAFGHAQSGIGPMAAEKARLVGCGPIEQTAATLDRKLRYRVDRKTPFRVSERNRGIRHNVACDDQSLAAGDLEGNVAGGVSRRV